MTRLNIPLFIALAASILAATDGRTNTLPHQRMIRKRVPGSFNALPRWEGLHARQDLLPGLGGNQNEPSETASASASRTTNAAAGSTTASSSRAVSTTAPAAQTTTSSAAAASNTASSSVPVSQSASTTSGGLLDSLTGLLGGTSTSSTVSSTSTTTSSIATTSSASSAPAPTSQPPRTTATPTLNIATPPPVVSNPTQSVTVVTSIAPEAAASQKAADKERTRKITKNTIISLVVIASCIGGAVAIWTVIRKWKLSPSERFDDRMQPIDWAPSGGAAGVRDEAIEEKRHRRAGSSGSHGSFTSGGVGQSELGHGANGARSVYSDHTGHNMQQAQDFPPAHDFTAGPAGYGQYYQGQQQQQYGYADLQRGPSVTESNYSNGASVTRGLSYSRGHGGYEAQPGAGGVPPLPNPYGGGYEYEDYGRQQGQGQGQGQYRGY